ncbi:MAG: BrnT family toxin [Nitrospirae bacterium]|nr:BrnT family toxin [Nitrospirota bacterium]
MKLINWNTEKSPKLKASRGICFEDIVFYIENGDILDDYRHPNQIRYPEQRIMVIGINNYAYLVPYVEDEEELFLKTIIPSRKTTAIYFGGKK